MKRYILDLNGVVQKHPTQQFIKFGVKEVLRFKLSPVLFIKILKKVKQNGGKIETPEEKALEERYYADNQHIKTPFLPGAKEKVKQLLESGPVHVCSANKHSDKSDKDYKEYLTKELGKFEEINFVYPFTSKLDFYKSVKLRFPKDKIVVIEDSPRHIDEAESLGLETIKTDRKIGIGVFDFSKEK